MNFDLDEDQALLKATVERFVADSYGDLEARRAARRTAAGFAAENWTRLAETGLLSMAVAAPHGGLGSSNVDIMLAMEALGAGLVAEPLLDVGIVAAGLLDIAGNAAQHQAVLRPLMAGQCIVALAHAEREARYNSAHVGTIVQPRGHGFAIDGAKTAVLAGGAADMLIVSARQSGGVRDASGIGFWLVPADAPGLERRSYRLADGSVAAEITLRGVEIAGQAALSGGLEMLTPVIARARLAAAAEMLGLMTFLFDTTLTHVKMRTQFGKALGAFQAIQHRMTDAYVLVEQARSQVLRAALAEAGAFNRAAAGAMAFVSEAGLSVAHTAVQMHGGMGITDELAIGHALKRLRVLALTFGNAAAALDDYRGR